MDPTPGLHELDTLPIDLLGVDSRGLAAVLPGPTLIHLPGTREPPLFVSVLMHGNEPVGWDAVRTLLARRLERHGEWRLPRALSLFIGNIAAAAQGLRHLPGQPDFNRVWPGSDRPWTPEHALMDQVVSIMARRGVFASLDLHNNTGSNPHYACINELDPRFLRLGTLFSRTLVHFTHPRGVQSLAMARHAPAVTVECGRAGEPAGVDHAMRFIDAALRLAELSAHPLPPQDFDLFRTVAQVRIRDDVAFDFQPADTGLALDPELERLNFHELPAGMAFGRLRAPGGPLPVAVHDATGTDIGARYFEIRDGELRLRTAIIPSMLTRDCQVIRQDCLCYLMARAAHGAP